MSPIYWYYLLFSVAFGVVVLTLILVGATETNGTAPLITGIVLLPFAVLIVSLFASVILRPLSITTTELRIPKAWGTTEVPLRRVAGVGLVYQFTPGSRAPAGWVLHVWDDLAHDYPIGRWIVVAWFMPRVPVHRRRLFSRRDWTLSLPRENADELARSRPGRVARRIFEVVMARQGEYGQLAKQALQKAVVYDPNAATHTAAWWAPDGSLGRANGMPARDPSRVTANSGIGAKSPSRARALKRGIGIALVSFAIGVVFSLSDGASNAAKPDAIQNALLLIAALFMFVGPIVGLVVGVRIWRRRTIPRASAQSIGAAGSDVVAEQFSANPAKIPQPHPAIKQAQRRALWVTLAGMAISATTALLFEFAVGRPGHLPNGILCAAALGQAPVHPIAACDAWRHHQLLISIWPASVFIANLILAFTYRFRSVRRLGRIRQQINTQES